MVTIQSLHVGHWFHRQRNSDLLTKYQQIWVDYEEKYKSFDYVEEFESKRQEAEWVKGKGDYVYWWSL